MDVLLDTNFVISCIKKKIDFVSELEALGFKVALPKEVLDELKDLKNDVSHSDRAAIGVALDMFDKLDIKRVKLGSGKVDDKLIEHGRKGSYIASLDAYIKRSVPNKVVINSATNGLMVERG